MFTEKELGHIDFLNQIIFGQGMISRKHDMSPDGSLTVCADQSGDMCLSIFDDENKCVANLEFCTRGSGGGGSPETHKALRELFVALVKDQHSSASCSRDGRFPLKPEIRALLDARKEG
jgi:hypothetical protein